MSDAILVLYAAVLVVNGCFLLGKVEAKSVWPVNFIIGLIAIVCAMYIGLTGSQGDASVFVATLLLLFAVVFVMMGINLATELDGNQWAIIVCLVFLFV